jgi:hypothetical protein
MTTGRLLRLLGSNRIRWTPNNALRILFLFQSSLWSALFRFIEHQRFGKKISAQDLPKDPVFIIGHWRTGTSFLFKLMSLDKAFVTPTLLQVAEPDSLLVSGPYYRPLLNQLVGRTRPMDSMAIGPDEPQEDEYAVFRLAGCSPLEKLVFPPEDKYFITEWIEDIQNGRETESEFLAIAEFFRKVSMTGNGRLLSKNPFHSMRMERLIRDYPGSRFIRIHRNPLDTVPSTINMWSILQKQNCLGRYAHLFTPEEICRGLNLVNRQIDCAASELPPSRYIELRFEDLEIDPLGEIQKIYSQFGFSLEAETMKGMKSYLDSVSDFTKNTFVLSGNQKDLILSEMNEYMSKMSYC